VHSHRRAFLLVLAMRKRKERRTSQKPISWGDLIKVVSSVLGCVHFTLKIWEWLRSHNLI
jgi:hypothetical protein